MSMRRLVPALILLALPLLTLAQEPKTGSSWYEDSVDLGFKFRAPKDWSFVPSQPGEQNLIGKYAPPNGQEVHLGNDAVLNHAYYLVKFDRRKKAAEKKLIGNEEVEISYQGLKSIDEWMSKGIDEGAAWRRVEGPKAIKAASEASVSVYEGNSTSRYSSTSQPQPIRAHVMVFKLAPEVELALVGTGPADKKKWRSFEDAYESLAKSLQRVVVKSVDLSAVGKDPRSQKRAKLEDEVKRSPGWSLHETPNYFILAATDDKALVEELKERLEGIRKIYERDYPPELSRKIKVVESKGEDEEGEGEGDDGADEPGDDAPPATPAQEPAPKADEGERSEGVLDALEAGRLSVVRLCKNADMYHQYGGPGGTSGYFSSFQGELLLYDNKDVSRDETWSTLSHEGFHQYIYAFFGNVSPHSWYNEGTGDYYGGYEYNPKSKKFTVKKDLGRQDNVLLVKDKLVPLQELVAWPQSKFYGNNEYDMPGWGAYAQGWSLIWFLREGKDKAKGWQKPWSKILDVYLETLLSSGKPKTAVETAFKNVDWKAFEASWKDFTGL